MRDLQRIAEECILKLKKINIPIQDKKIVEIKFTRIKGLGKCLKTIDDEYYIKISTLYENEIIDISELYATICHELIHTCENCMNHNNKWLQYAQLVDSEYNYGIVGYKTTYDIKHKNKPILGRMECPNCIGYWDIREMKSWKQIKEGTKCYCGWCGREMKLKQKMPNG